VDQCQSDANDLSVFQENSELAVVVYGPPEGEATGWQRQGGRDRMLQILNDAEPRYVFLSDLLLLFYTPLSHLSMFSWACPLPSFLLRLSHLLFMC